MCLNDSFSHHALQTVYSGLLSDEAIAGLQDPLTVCEAYSLRNCRFLLLDLLFVVGLIQSFYINIIYFLMTYFIIKDTLIISYLFYYLNKKV
jgi:hypothetical protein